MIHNGMTFGMDGPQITGWWVNPKTGDKFNAIDTFFEDNNLLVKAADGRILNYNVLQNYVHTDKPNDVPVENPTPKNELNNLPANILSELEGPEGEEENSLLIPDDNIFGAPIRHEDKTSMTITTTPSKPSIGDFDIINRALGSKSQPSIKGEVAWRSFPESEIKMLIDMMGVKKSDIIEYYIDKISIKDIESAVRETIKKYISDKLSGENYEKKKTTTSKK